MTMNRRPIDDISRHVGSLVKGFSPFYHSKLAKSLDVTRRTFMERLVSPKVLEASISLHYDAYLKGLLWLDYFTTVLAGQTDVLGNLRFIKEEMKKKSEKPLVPGPLALIATGAWAHNLAEGLLTSREVEERFQKTDEKSVFAGQLDKVGPYYLALGSMISSFVCGWRREAIPHLATRNELLALMFIDAVISLTEVPRARELVEEKRWREASQEAAASLLSYSTPERLREHLEPALAGKKGL